MVFAPNYTQIPNVILDELMPILGFAELKIIYAICRKTFGWHKVRDKISLSQLEKQTGLDRKGVIRAVKSLVKKSIITKEVTGEKGEESTSYQLIIKEEFKQCLTGSIMPLGGGGMEPLGGSGTVPPTKESNLKKDINNNPYIPLKGEKREVCKFIFLSQEEEEKLIKELGADLAKECFQYFSDWKIESGKEKPGKSDYRALKRWVILAVKEKKLREKKVVAGEKFVAQGASFPNSPMEDKKLANEIYAKTRPRDDIQLGPDYIEFGAGMATKCFKFGDKNFRDNCNLELQKRKIKIW